MHKRILSLSFFAFFLIAFINWSCTKLDTTDIGAGLLPAVDNVHTFDTTLSINATQGIFNDSTYITYLDDQAVGKISTDPLFGQTTANIFFQPKPSFYPYYLGGVASDTILGVDSIVLCLKYKGFYGDSASLVNLEVHQINSPAFRDSGAVSRKVDFSLTPGGSLGPVIGSTTFDVRRLADTVFYKNHRDYSVDLIRIKMDPAWVSQLIGRDSSATNSANNAFYSDSIFRRFYNGLAVTAGPTGSTLVYTNVADTNTKLEIHYRKKSGTIDTTFTSFHQNTGLDDGAYSASANQIIRNRSGYPIANPASTEIYLQSAPGTYANLNIPALSTLDNRIIHRADITLEQIPGGAGDDRFLAPSTLYLDLKDTSTTDKWKPIYYDLNPNVVYYPDYHASPFYPGDIDFTYFGGFRRDRIDQFGNKIYYYNFNVTRYVQQIVTQHTPNYTLRVFPAYKFSYPQYLNQLLPVSGSLNSIAFGRIRVGSGTNANYKLRMHIVYSKL